MKLTTLKMKTDEVMGFWEDDGIVPVTSINERFDLDWPADISQLLEQNRLDELNQWYRTEGKSRLPELTPAAVDPQQARFAPLYRRPRKIWGIGLNYAAHAADLDEKTPQGIPGSFMKPDTTLIGPGDAIRIPLVSEKTTAEGELAIIIGKTCRQVPETDWLSVVAGFTTVIDMTAEDILRQNVRYLTVSKSFDTFFSFGPQLLTPDEIEDVAALNVATVINRTIHARNTVARMTFSPAFLVAFLSRVMTLLPGDIISTGTPGAVQINDGDRVECRIDGFQPLQNPVEDLKKQIHR
jgi:2-keto-4-pentenoate hydratase/2-oxohepta-3-ene-1,7-dioic acid hydratase in catechol pathway